MKKALLIILVLMLTAAFGFGDRFRLGGGAAGNFMNKPSYDDIVAGKEVDILPVIYWEVLTGRHFSFGHTYSFGFDKKDAELSGMKNKWILDWIGSFNFVFHIFDRSKKLDPFLDAGIGCAGRADISAYYYNGYSRSEADPMLLSLFLKVGAGFTFKFHGFHIGTRFDYRFFNESMPGTDFDQYPLKNFQLIIFAGLSFGS
jgi:hypothetical protein